MNLKGKRVLITGSALRIGSELAEAFSKRGAEILVHYNSSEKEALQLSENINAEILKFDLNKINEIPAFFKKCGHIDILINNASVFNPKAIAEEENQEVLKHYNINFFAALELMKIFKKKLGKKCGIIINFLDQCVANTSIDEGSYAFSKKSLRDATLAAAKQWAPQIRVNGICPGPVLPPADKPYADMRKVLKNVPMKKPVDINEIVAAALFLLANDSITGELINIDGGQHLNQ